MVPGTRMSLAAGPLLRRERWVIALSSLVRSSSTSTPTESADGNSSSSAPHSASSSWFGSCACAAISRIDEIALSLRSSRRCSRSESCTPASTAELCQKRWLSDASSDDSTRLGDCRSTTVTWASNSLRPLGCASGSSTRIRLLAMMISSWSCRTPDWMRWPLT